MSIEIDTSTLNSAAKDSGSPFSNLRDSFKRVLSPDRARADQGTNRSPTTEGTRLLFIRSLRKICVRGRGGYALLWRDKRI
jgi:hypothetical protein